MKDTVIKPLTQGKLSEAVDLVLAAKLDTREEIEHHLEDLASHYVSVDKNDKIVGVIGWYQDSVSYATEAMGNKFPGEESYWVGFFAVDEKLRGRKIGFTLIKKLEVVLKERGVKELWVSSVPDTQKYYERQGFQYFMRGEIGGNPKVFLVKRW